MAVKKALATDTVLAQRGKRYGTFTNHSLITQTLKKTFYALNPHLSVEEAEAADMVMHKVGRIVNGDPWYDDSWQDIAGYSKLVLQDRFLKMENPRDHLQIRAGDSTAPLVLAFIRVQSQVKAAPLPEHLDFYVMQILHWLGSIAGRSVIPCNLLVPIDGNIILDITKQYYWSQIVLIAEEATKYVRMQKIASK